MIGKEGRESIPYLTWCMSILSESHQGSQYPDTKGILQERAFRFQRCSYRGYIFCHLSVWLYDALSLYVMNALLLRVLMCVPMYLFGHCYYQNNGKRTSLKIKTFIFYCVGASFYCGCVLGALISGPIADTSGRKIITITSLSVIVLNGILSHYIVKLWMFFPLQFLAGKKSNSIKNSR